MALALSRSVAFLFALLMSFPAVVMFADVEPVVPIRGFIFDMCSHVWFYPHASDWQEFDGGGFTIRSPGDAALVQSGEGRGTIYNDRVMLAYALVDTPDALPAHAVNISEKMVIVGGKPGTLRTAEIPGRTESYFVQLIVPDAGKDANGQLRTLDIHGWMPSEERRWLAVEMLTSVDFSPPFGGMMLPSRPLVPEPVVVIEDPNPRSTP